MKGISKGEDKKENVIVQRRLIHINKRRVREKQEERKDCCEG